MSDVSTQPAYTPAGYCPKCGYRVDPGKCPECGREVKSPLRRHPRVIWRRRLAVLYICLGVVAGVVTLWLNGANWAAVYLPDAIVIYLAESGPRSDKSLSAWAARVVQSRDISKGILEAPLARQRDRRIRSQLQGLAGHDWAGIYDCGSVVLAIAPQEGFTLFYADGPGILSLIDHGSIQPLGPTRMRFKGTGLEELSELSAKYNWPDIRTQFVFGHGCHWERRVGAPLADAALVRWGEQRLLVPQREILAFCQDVNAGRSMKCFWRRHNTNMRYGLPQVPPEYQKYILPRPLFIKLVTVSAVEVHRKAVQCSSTRWFDEHRSVVQVMSDDANLIQPGMRFFRREKSVVARAVALSRDNDLWTAEYIDWTPHHPEDVHGPSVGDVMSTTKALDPFPSFDSKSFDAYELLRGEAAKLKLD